MENNNHKGSVKIMPKKSNVNINMWQKLINIIIKEDDLIKDIDDYIAKVEKERELNFKDTLIILEKMENYFLNTKKEFQIPFREKIADEFKEIYFLRREDQNLTESQINVFREYLNFVVFSFGFYPMKEDGEKMNKAEVTKWFHSIYKKHQEGENIVYEEKPKKEKVPVKKQSKPKEESTTSTQKVIVEKKIDFNEIMDILSGDILWNYVFNQTERQELLKLMNLSKPELDEFSQKQWKDLYILAEKFEVIKDLGKQLATFFDVYKQKNKEKIIRRLSSLEPEKVEEFSYPFIWDNYLSIHAKKRVINSLKFDIEDAIKKWGEFDSNQKKKLIPLMENAFRNNTFDYIRVFKAVKKGQQRSEEEKYIKELEKYITGFYFEFLTEQEKKYFLKLNRDFLIGKKESAVDEMKVLFQKVRDDNRITDKKLKLFIEDFDFMGNLYGLLKEIEIKTQDKTIRDVKDYFFELKEVKYLGRPVFADPNNFYNEQNDIVIYTRIDEIDGGRANRENLNAILKEQFPEIIVMKTTGFEYRIILNKDDLLLEEIVWNNIYKSEREDLLHWAFSNMTLFHLAEEDWDGIDPETQIQIGKVIEDWIDEGNELREIRGETKLDWIEFKTKKHKRLELIRTKINILIDDSEDVYDAFHKRTEETDSFRKEMPKTVGELWDRIPQFKRAELIQTIYTPEYYEALKEEEEITCLDYTLIHKQTFESSESDEMIKVVQKNWSNLNKSMKTDLTHLKDYIFKWFNEDLDDGEYESGWSPISS